MTSVCQQRRDCHKIVITFQWSISKSRLTWIHLNRALVWYILEVIACFHRVCIYCGLYTVDLNPIHNILVAWFAVAFLTNVYEIVRNIQLAMDAWKGNLTEMCIPYVYAPQWYPVSCIGCCLWFQCISILCIMTLYRSLYRIHLKQC